MSDLATFECAECRRMMVRLAGPAPYPLCAACITMPGWTEDPEIARYLVAGAVDAPQPLTPDPPPTRAKRSSLGAAIASLLWVCVLAWTLLQFF